MRLVSSAILILLWGSLAGAADDEDVVGFLEVKDRAWRESLPSRLRIAELAEMGPDRAVSRDIWMWDSRIQYLEELRTSRTVIKRFCTWDESAWFVASTEPAYGGGWQATIAKTHPEAGGWRWSLPHLWKYPGQSADLPGLLRSGPVMSVKENETGYSIHVAVNSTVAKLLRENRQFGGLVGHIVDVDRDHDWRPSRITRVVRGTLAEAGEPAPKAMFGGKYQVIVLDDTVYSAWQRVGRVWVPLTVERLTHVIGNEVSQSRITLKGTVEVVTELPSHVTFDRVPPPEFGKQGVIRDVIRQTTEIIDMRGDGRLRERQTEALRELSELREEGRPVSGESRSRVAIMFVLALLGASAVLVSIWLVRSRVPKQ